MSAEYGALSPSVLYSKRKSVSKLFGGIVVLTGEKFRVTHFLCELRTDCKGHLLLVLELFLSSIENGALMFYESLRTDRCSKLRMLRRR
jgi:hypothetical protein